RAPVPRALLAVLHAAPAPRGLRVFVLVPHYVVMLTNADYDRARRYTISGRGAPVRVIPARLTGTGQHSPAALAERSEGAMVHVGCARPATASMVFSPSPVL